MNSHKEIVQDKKTADDFAMSWNNLPEGPIYTEEQFLEGNEIIVYLVDPIRKITSHLPWWFTKYFIATPLVTPYYLYAKSLSLFKRNSLLEKLSLYDYSLWIAKREFAFFRHVAFDQLVTPQTVYITKAEIKKWLAFYPEIDKASAYITMRNGNSWKFGGGIKS